ncbi:hypothetical protein Bca4012_037270 [Brassica carinata]
MPPPPPANLDEISRYDLISAALHTLIINVFLMMLVFMDLWRYISVLFGDKSYSTYHAFLLVSSH